MNTPTKTEVAPVARTVKLAEFLTNKMEDFKAVETVDSAKFLRVVKNAILRDPEIAEASAQSVYLECMKAMNDGLVLDGREAALTRFKTNKRRKEGNQWVDNWQVEVVYIPMVAGIMKRVRASGEIKSWTVELVYRQEFEEGKFRYRAAPDPIIEHEPIIVGERGPVVAAYSAVKLADGSHHYEVMTLDQLLAIKSRTKSRKKKTVNNETVEEISGPWATDEEEMFRKTVIRRHSKRLPVSSATMDVASRVDGLYDMDVEPIEEPAAPEPRKAKSNASSKLKKLTDKAKAEAAERAAAAKEETEEDEADEKQALDGEIIDGETGEIISEAGAGRTADPEDEF